MKKLQQMRACLARVIAAGGRKLVTAVNAVVTSVGIHLGGRCTATCSGAIGDATLVRFVSDGVVCDNDGVPCGVAMGDGLDGLEVGLASLGGSDRTIRVLASGAVASGDRVVADNTKVKTLPTAPGTYYQVGQALTSTLTDGDCLEMAPCVPIKIVVS